MEFNMKSATLLAAVAASAVMATAGLGSVALAADLPSRTAAPMAPVEPIVPVFTWTGFYVGVNAGYGWNTNDDNGDVFVPGVGYVGSSGSDGGFVGGGQIGYNYQFGQFVAGVEADIQYADLNSNNDNGYYYSGTGGYFGSNSNGVEWFGTVRARLGFAIDRALIYATGGFAYGGGGGGNGGYYNGYYFDNGGDDVRTGWTLGGGLEYAFTDNLTARVEGLYVNLGKDGNNGFAYDAAYLGGNRKDTEFGVVRAGLNYKFSSF
jgi:outer membrane immunogenic protein